jgi:hypothetical protein
VGDDGRRCLAVLEDGQQVVGVVDLRPSRWGVERSAIPAPVVDDDAAIGKV